jgi:hypothetical protein
MKRAIDGTARLFMVLFAALMFTLGIIHFVAPEWYHGFYPGFEYDQGDVFDREAVKTIGLWALMCGALASYAAMKWKESAKLTVFIAASCFAYILAQFDSFMHGYFPWPIALTFALLGSLFLISKTAIKAE